MLSFFRYLFGKRSDLSRLNKNDALLGKIVLDIHRKRLSAELGWLPLYFIQPIHPIDRGEALESKDKRKRIVRQNLQELLGKDRISKELLTELLPSVSGIKVVELGPQLFVSFEGNGRLAALQEVLPEDSEIEVEVYRFDGKGRVKMLRRINRVRRWNGLGTL